MLALSVVDLFVNPGKYFSNPLFLVFVAFQVWMMIDALRREEWIWLLFMLVFPLINPILYYFLVYRQSQPLNRPNFELPGAANRRRIKELQDQIHHLDKAHHHSQLADIYFTQGKLNEAEAEYKAALERDGEDLETLAHYGQCLLRMSRLQEARPLLERVVKENPQHEYGQTLMAYAEVLGALGEKDAALQAWREVLEHHGYAEARVQFAQLLIEKGDQSAAQRELEEVINDAGHGPAFQRKREKPWVKRAEALLNSIK